MVRGRREDNRMGENQTEMLGCRRLIGGQNEWGRRSFLSKTLWVMIKMRREAPIRELRRGEKGVREHGILHAAIGEGGGHEENVVGAPHIYQLKELEGGKAGQE